MTEEMRYAIELERVKIANYIRDQARGFDKALWFCEDSTTTRCLRRFANAIEDGLY